jgi:hypothetical protein
LRYTGHDAFVADGSSVEISVTDWTQEQRDDLGFLLDDASIAHAWSGDRLVVSAAAAPRVHELVSYLSTPNNDEHRPLDGGLVYPVFEASESCVVEDALPAEVFSFSFPEGQAPLSFAASWTFERVHDDPASGMDSWRWSRQSRAGYVELTSEVLDRASPSRAVLRVHDSLGQIWRETWTLAPSGPDTVVSLHIEVDRAAPDALTRPDMKFRSERIASWYAAQRVSIVRTKYEVNRRSDRRG